eukprot:EG_transcript_3172
MKWRPAETAHLRRVTFRPAAMYRNVGSGPPYLEPEEEEMRPTGSPQPKGESPGLHGKAAVGDVKHFLSSTLFRHQDDALDAEEDFATIDWAADQELVQRRPEGRSARRMAGRYHWAHVLWGSSQGWVAAALVGLGTGIIAWCMEVTVQWLADTKSGYCHGRPWFSREVCCRHAAGEVDCDEWVTWSEQFRVTHQVPQELVSFIIYTTIALGLAITSAWLCKTFAKYASGSGIAEIKTILGGTNINDFLGGWTLLIKVIGLSLSVGSGLSVGKEGPYVHIAACVGNLVAQRFARFRAHESKKRELISASAAAGVAVAFGAPVGGVLFSLEEASYFFPHKVMWRTFFCAVMATMTLHFMDPHGNGKIVMFQVNHRHAWKWFEVIPFTLVGALGGLIGGTFTYFNIRWARFKKKSWLKAHPILEVAGLTAITAVLQFPNPYMRGDMCETMARMFQDCRPGASDHMCLQTSVEYIRLLIAGLLKTILMVFSIGLKLPAGLFVPSLYTGACFGRLVGVLLRDFYEAHPEWALFAECHHSPAQCVVPGVYAIVGAAAVLSGVTHMTICLAVIVFEITGDLEIVMPVMLAVLTSKLVSEMIAGRSPIYVQQIRLNNYPFLDPKLEVDTPATAKSLIQCQHLQVLTERGYTVADIENLLNRYEFSGFPVVNDIEHLLIIGYITRKNLQLALRKGLRDPSLGPQSEVVFSDTSKRRASVGAISPNPEDTVKVMDISDYVDPAPIQADVNTSIQRVLHLFKSLGLRCCMVSQAGKLQGIITRKDLLSFVYDAEKEPAPIPADFGSESEASEAASAVEAPSPSVIRVRRSRSKAS